MSTSYSNHLSRQDKVKASLVVLAYNQEHFVADAVGGALSQTYGDLEIILSDDCSKDKTYEVMERSVAHYAGPHQVILNRNPRNLGLAGHVNRCMQMARGEVILLSGGDDVSLPDRTRTSCALLAARPSLCAVSMAILKFKRFEDKLLQMSPPRGKEEVYTLEAVLANPLFHISGASRAFHRTVFENFGDLDPRTASEDSTILLRCLMTGSVLQSPQVGVLYRIHGQNLHASQHKYLIDYGSIHQQYLSDLHLAVNKGMVSKSQAEQLSAALKRKLQRRKTEIALSMPGGRMRKLATLMLSRDFRLCEKFSSAFRTILPKRSKTPTAYV